MNYSGHAQCQEAGFTLVETLVAFLVLSLSLMMFAQGISLTTRQIRTADVSIEARKLGQIVMAAAQGDSSLPGAEGRDDVRKLFWRWTRKHFLRTEAGKMLRPANLIVVEIARDATTPAIYTLKSINFDQPSPG